MAPRRASLVTVAEAGRAMDVSVSTVWRLIRRGALPSVRRSGRRLIPATALSSPRSPGEHRSIPPFDDRHPIFRLVGAGRGGGRPPGARDKHGILVKRG